ncbi:hypothetical protein V5O48_000314 [Marasmius crinis-equi]|uniref:Cytochrome P450 n=1 Tax=Marasmius crinis-equi TaxID=585013 RepID=A0ABR3G1L4_9AGAR
MYLKWAKEFGRLFRIKAALFQPDIVVVVDSTAAQYIFQNAYTYVKAPAFRPLMAKLLGPGIVWAEGDEHRRQRKLIAPAFRSPILSCIETLNADDTRIYSTGAIQGMFDDIYSSAEKTADRLSSHITSSDATKGHNLVMNIIPYISDCTLDIIGRIGFNYDFEAGESPEAKKIDASWHEDVILGRSFGGFFAPILLQICPWVTKLPIPALQTDGATKMITTKLAGDMYDDPHRTGRGKDILSLLKEVESDGEVEMSRETLLSNIATLLMVGHETSAGTVSYTLLELARDKRVQTKLREELRQAGTLTYDNVQSLEYLDAVVKEGLRLHPSSPRTERVALQDDVIPLGRPILAREGRTMDALPVKAGQVFHVSFKALNVDPEVWGDDAEVFKPERWVVAGGLPDPSELPRGPWTNVASFCDGPRGCIGWRLAVLEMKVIIAMLIRRFEFEATNYKVEQYISPTLQSFVNGEARIMPLYVSVIAEA